MERGDNPYNWRKVVGQMMDYAATAASVWSEHNMRQTFEAMCNRDRKDPHDEIRKLLQADDEPDIDAFWEQVATNLDKRQMRLLFVANDISDELERVVKFLNEQMQNMEVLAVELKEYYDTSNTPKALVSRVITTTPKALVSRVIEQAESHAPLKDAPKKCLCGCDEDTNDRFASGHDARIREALNHAESGHIRDIDLKCLEYAAKRCQEDPTLYYSRYRSGDIIRLADEARAKYRRQNQP